MPIRVRGADAGGEQVDVQVGEQDEVEVKHGPHGPLEQHGVLVRARARVRVRGRGRVRVRVKVRVRVRVRV